MTTLDVLQPAIFRLGQRRYRKIPMTGTDLPKTEIMTDYAEQDPFYYEEVDSCSVLEAYTIEKTVNGSYKGILQNIPSFYFKFIYGKSGLTCKNIETQTKTTIILPAKGMQGDIEIAGKEKCDVLGAFKKVKNVIDMHRNEQRANHFLSFPLISPQLAERFDDFKQKVLNMKVQGFKSSMFQIAERFHLTICMMSFLNDAEITKNVQADSIGVGLTPAKKQSGQTNKYLPAGPLKVLLQGIEYMNDDPTEVDILYAKIIPLSVEGDKLQSFVDELSKALALLGFAKKDYNFVKLHATVVNTLFSTSYEKQKIQKRQTFDARQILKELHDFNLGEAVIKKVEISIRGKFCKYSGNYENCGFITL